MSITRKTLKNGPLMGSVPVRFDSRFAKLNSRFVEFDSRFAKVDSRFSQ